MAFIATPQNSMKGEVFVFDLEIVGEPSDPSTCHIWDLAFVHVGSGEALHCKVDPQLETYPPPPSCELFPVTKVFLANHDAKPFAEVLPRLLGFIELHSPHVQSYHGPVVLVSHGAFVLDKPVLEREFARVNRVVPSHWRFYDSLPFFRRVFRRAKSYKLAALYEHVFWAPPGTSHFASADAAALVKLLRRATGGDMTRLYGAYVPPYLSALQTIKYVGSQKEMLLVSRANVTCVEDLVVCLAKCCGFERSRVARFLQDKCHFDRVSAERVSNSLQKIMLTV